METQKTSRQHIAALRAETDRQHFSRLTAINDLDAELFGEPLKCLMGGRIFCRVLKSHRKELGLTLREFCSKNGFDPGNYSRMERGLSSPPQGEQLLRKYATALGIKQDTDAWIEFFDAAAASRGEFPRDLRSDEELIDKLPVLFRTLRGTPNPAEKLDELIEMMRKE